MAKCVKTLESNFLLGYLMSQTGVQINFGTGRDS